MDKTKILIVDDNRSVTNICRKLLEFAGPFIVREVNAGLHAVSAAREFQPKIILLDLEMPDRSGDEIIPELLGEPMLAETNIVLISGLMNRRTSAGKDVLTGLPVLPKPIEPGDLLRKVEELLRPRVPRPVNAA